jgi:hypothetical protein
METEILYKKEKTTLQLTEKFGSVRFSVLPKNSIFKNKIHLGSVCFVGIEFHFNNYNLDKN